MNKTLLIGILLGTIFVSLLWLLFGSSAPTVEAPTEITGDSLKNDTVDGSENNDNTTNSREGSPETVSDIGTDSGMEFPSTDGKNTLDLSAQSYTTVPESVFDKRNTETLNLSNNLLGSLQAEIRHLENLKILDLSNNELTNIPAELGQLSDLEVLNLSGNHLTGLPYELGNLKNLKILDLRGNPYSQMDLDIIIQGLPSSTKIFTQ